MSENVINKAQNATMQKNDNNNNLKWRVFKWHVVTYKEDGMITDPPEFNTDVLVSTIVGDGYGKITEYRFIAQYTTDGHWTNCDSDIVIAWGELPAPYRS